MDSQSPEFEPESFDSALISTHQASRSALALPAAAGAALIGALVWAATSHFTKYEIGWIAWGIGAGAGAACAALGGRTQVHAMLCAAIALAGIAGGKSLAILLDRSSIPSHLSVTIKIDGKDVDVRTLFEEERESARLWVECGDDPSVDQVRSFMIQRGFVKPGSVPDSREIQMFQAAFGPRLRELHASPQTLDQWLEAQGLPPNKPVPSFSEHFRATLSPFDLLWVLLGLSSAFGIVQNAGKQQQVAEQGARQAERRAR